MRTTPLSILGRATAALAMGVCLAQTARAAAPSWPGGVIFYAFSADYSEAGRNVVRGAMNEWMDTGASIAFVPAPPGTISVDGSGNPTFAPGGPFLWIKDSGAGSAAGIGSGTPNVGNFSDPIDRGHALHELGHVLGFWHTHQRPDRAEHVHVPSKYAQDKNHKIRPAADWPARALDTAYDLDSVMHYDRCTFSEEGCPGVAPDFLSNRGGTWSIITNDRLAWERIGKWLGGPNTTPLSNLDEQMARNVYGSGAVTHVNPGDPCVIENGSPICNRLGGDLAGPYKNLSGVLGDIKNGSLPARVLMVSPGNHTVSSSSSRIDTPLRIFSTGGTVRIRR